MVAITGHIPTWGKSILIVPRTTLVSHALLHQPKFYASYETDGSSPNMYCLIQHSYGAIWRREHNTLVAKLKAKNKLRVRSDPLAKVRAAVKAKKEKEQKIKEEQERIAAKYKTVKKRQSN